MKDYEHVVYSINVEDIQTVALEEFGRTLTDDELKIVENKIGDYIPWYDMVDAVISDHLDIEQRSETFDEVP